MKTRPMRLAMFDLQKNFGGDDGTRTHDLRFIGGEDRTRTCDFGVTSTLKIKIKIAGSCLTRRLLFLFTHSTS